MKVRVGFEGGGQELRDSRLVQFEFLRNHQIIWSDDLPTDILTLIEEDFKIPLTLQVVNNQSLQSITNFSIDSHTCGQVIQNLKVDGNAAINGRGLTPGTCEIVVAAVPASETLGSRHAEHM